MITLWVKVVHVLLKEKKLFSVNIALPAVGLALILCWTVLQLVFLVMD